MMCRFTCGSQNVAWTFRPDLDRQSIWWQPSHTYHDVVGEVIVYKKLPCSPEKLKKINDELQVTGGDTRIAYHGLPAYAVANVARNSFLASDSKERGHQSLEGKHGAYVSPFPTTAWGYSTPHILKDKDLPPRATTLDQVHVPGHGQS